MMKQRKLARQLLAAAVLSASLVDGALASFVSADSSFGSNTLVFDTQTGLEWLKLDATLGLSYNTVTSQMDGGELFSGFSVASAADVTSLFKNAEVWAPLFPLTSPDALTAGASFASYFGGYATTTGIRLEGMTSDALSAFHTQRSVGLGYTPGQSISSWDDAYHSDSGQIASVGTWLYRPVAPIPEPTTYLMMLSGMALLGVLVRRRSEK